MHPALCQPGGIDIHVIDPELFYPHLLRNKKIVCPSCKQGVQKDGYNKGFMVVRNTFKIELMKVRRYRCTQCKSTQKEEGSCSARSFGALDRYNDA